MQYRASVFLAIAVYLTFVAEDLIAQGFEQLQASESQLEEQLQRPVTAAWHGQELGSALLRLSEVSGFAFWLDRRVDPQSTIDLSFTNQPIRRALAQLTEQQGLGLSVLGGIVYVGPQESARELATLIQKARDVLSDAPKSVRRRWLEALPTDWPRLSEPRLLLDELMQEAEINLAGTEQIPHDLWDAKQLPPLGLVDKTVLLLVGFDLTCRIAPDGGSCQIVPIQRPVEITREYRIAQHRKAILERLSQELAQAKIERKGRLTIVTGRWEDQRAAERIIAGKNSPSKQKAIRPNRPSQQVYSLGVKNQPVGRIVEQLARQLKLVVVWNEASLVASKRTKDSLVSFTVENASLDELLESALAPAGLTFERDANRIEIEAKP